MKKIVSVMCAALMLMLALSLAACGSGGGSDISGTYKLTEMTVGGEDMTSYLDLLGDITLTVEGDKATLDMAGESAEMTVDASAQTLIGEDGTASPYTVEGGKLTLEESGSDTHMVFEKQ